MTKVEELRETIVACVADSKAILSHQVAEQFVDSLIAAAREEGRAEGAEKVKTNLEAWLLREDNEDVTVTHYTSTYTARHINVQAVIDFLHDRVLAPAPKEEGEKEEGE